jgi:hypothetical protein
MKFMSIVMATPEHYGQPTPELMEAIGKLSERETKAGRMVGGGGLTPIEEGARVGVRKGQVVVQDGPFTETKEVIGGYAIFELGSLDEALALAREFMQLHVEHMPGWEGTCEVRAMTTGDCG